MISERLKRVSTLFLFSLLIDMLLKRRRSAWKRVKKTTNIDVKCKFCICGVNNCPKLSCFIYNRSTYNYCYVIKTKIIKKKEYETLPNSITHIG